MKFFFVAGLEHSGTTLSEQLLSSHPQVLSLGEIASFFSTSHMREYYKRWGSYSDVRMCSCGKDWSDCTFWSPILHLCGLYSSSPIQAKYEELLLTIKDRYPHDTIVTDSSKSSEAHAALSLAIGRTGLSEDDLSTIFTVKDTRSFASSLQRKSQRRDFFSAYRSMNYWAAQNSKILSELTQTSRELIVNLYEHLCLDPLAQMNLIFRKSRISQIEAFDLSNQRSHIAMGNKDFLMRNRKSVKYDQRWFLEDRVSLAYLLNHKARSLNKYFYKTSSEQAARLAETQPD